VKTEKEVTFENVKETSRFHRSSTKKAHHNILQTKEVSPEILRKHQFILEKNIEEAENKLDHSKISIKKKSLYK
jgi:hypothetical protein